MKLTITIEGPLTDNNVSAALHEVEHSLLGTNYGMSEWGPAPVRPDEMPDELIVLTRLEQPAVA